MRKSITALTSSSSRSSKPAIYGVVAAAEVERLRPLSASGPNANNDAGSLELAAAEMAHAAAELVALEKDILRSSENGADASLLAAKETSR